MAQILLRRLSSQNPKPFFSHGLPFRPFSTSRPTPSDPQTPKPNLSARLSFVFDQIDQIEKDRSEKDQTLQRIRSWRQSKNAEKTIHNDSQNPHSGIGFQNDANSNFAESNSADSIMGESNLRLGSKNGAKSDSVELKLGGESKLEAELVHPWPEWIELMERLVQQNYFDHRRKDEDQMVQQLGFDVSGVKDHVGIDFRDFKSVQTACLNFGKDRFDILRSLSRQDIQILVGYGCPSADKKVVFSAKLLRKHVHLDEGDVCSSCSLRSSCERAYLITNKEDEARTIDVMRVLLTFGFDPVTGSVVNKSLLKQKSVKTVIRKLLHEVVKLSAVPIDPNLPPPVIKKAPPKVKQPPPPPRKRVGRDDIEMKKGDWLCPKCDFMNFAKNTVCLQCDAKRPKRQLLPGEWECPECNFLNYRRNMACFHCECKRPPDEFVESKLQERQHGPRTRLEKTASRPEVSNAWNFDFDDNESDGADVSAFEYADSSVRGEDSPLDTRAQGDYRVSEDDFSEARRIPRVDEREYHPDSKRPGKGFDDFDDEEDDVDSYELDNQDSNSVRKNSLNNFSAIEGYSEHEIDGSDDNLLARRTTSSPSYNKPCKPMRQRAAFSEDDELNSDMDEGLSVHPDWKSSHVADSRHRSRGRGPTGPSRGLSFGSDEEQGLYSDVDDDPDEDFGHRESTGKKLGSGRRDYQRRGSYDIEDDRFSGSESESDDQRSRRNRFRGNKVEASGRGKNSKSPANYKFTRDAESRSRGMTSDRRDSFNDDFNRSSRGSRGNSRGFRGDDNVGRRMNARGGDLEKFKGPRREGYGNRQRGDAESRSRGMMSDRRDSFKDDFNRSSRGPRGNSKGFRGDDNVGRRTNARGGDFQKFKGPRQEGYGNRQRGRFNEYDRGMDGDLGECRNSRRVIER